MLEYGVNFSFCLGTLIILLANMIDDGSFQEQNEEGKKYEAQNSFPWTTDNPPSLPVLSIYNISIGHIDQIFILKGDMLRNVIKSSPSETPT